MKKIIVLDTETTGLQPDTDELLQLSIIDATGEVLYDSYFKPANADSWKEAEAVNHISPEMVKNAPPIETQIETINRIIHDADMIIGYNVGFDLSFLAYAAITVPDTRIVDVMKIFAPIYGEQDEKHGGFRWKSLVTAAEYYNFNWSKYPAHNSLGDCFATLYVFDRLRLHVNILIDRLINNGSYWLWDKIDIYEEESAGSTPEQIAEDVEDGDMIPWYPRVNNDEDEGDNVVNYVPF